MKGRQQIDVWLKCMKQVKGLFIGFERILIWIWIHYRINQVIIINFIIIIEGFLARKIKIKAQIKI